MSKSLKTAFLIFSMMGLTAGCAGGPAGGPGSTLTEEQARGQRLFDQHCESCHATASEAVIVGPSVQNIGEIADDRVEGLSAEEYLLESINKPSAYIVEGFSDQMPATLGQSLRAEDKEALIAYLLTLR